MRSRFASLLLVALAGGSALAGETDALSTGKNAADALSRAFRDRLDAAATAPDPSVAFSVCSYQAKALTAEVERRMGVRIKRTSLRLRNPGNAPDRYEQAILERFDSFARAGSPLEDVFEQATQDGKKVYRYVQPIYVGRSCTTCHGTVAELVPDVRRMLEERYPGDRATGYQAGDVRGIVSVVIPSE